MRKTGRLYHLSPGHGGVSVAPFLILLVGGGLTLRAEESVRVYSSEGPAPALREAATAFSPSETVKVIGGPPSEWVERAASDADVVCSSAEFMMADFIHNQALQVAPSTVTPLYMRPSAILVRPGNPKRLEDFPDLLRPGVRVMVVGGSGQTGLWEDMASRTGDIEGVRRLRGNIVFCAAHSTQAVQVWRENKDIDAWITWDIWHIPLRTEASLVRVSRDYLIFRLCSVALTTRGLAKPLAARYTKFLASPEGARIFASWGWMTSSTNTEVGDRNQEIKIVCDAGRNLATSRDTRVLPEIQRFIDGYETLGVRPRDLRIKIVIQGEAAGCLLKDADYRKWKGTAEGNPDRALVQRLSESGVSLEVSTADLAERGWSREALLEGVAVIRGAPQRVIELQHQGYAYLVF